jgi:hypothetical protein
MMELRRSLEAFVLAGAVLVAAPGIVSAAHRPLEERAGGLNAPWHAEAGHSEHGRDHDGRGRDHRGSGDTFVEFDGFPVYVDDCRYLRRMWRDTGGHFWLRRYEQCMRG